MFKIDMTSLIIEYFVQALKKTMTTKLSLDG